MELIVNIFVCEKEMEKNSRKLNKCENKKKKKGDFPYIIFISIERSFNNLFTILKYLENKNNRLKSPRDWRILRIEFPEGTSL